MTRIYKLLERCGIEMMPGYQSWMDGIEHQTWSLLGEMINDLDQQLINHVLVMPYVWDTFDGASMETPWDHQQEIDALQRLVDLRDRNIRSDVPERRDEDHPWCCPVWEMFHSEPVYSNDDPW